eukprot:TRINITY_DN936_c0_g2_i4.p1 TRINITY_DN936_c0_g2~~TRINITY_DN936_c0_g2_i4.p1  ORF type:complete len:697 (+),score=205.82 TRINITY_DN936_c0_g2_i4:295-2091(+)
MKLLDHENISKLLEVIDTSRHLYLVLELCEGGELFDYIVAHHRIKEPEARKLFRQIVSGVAYCHHHMVIHRDLKPENLLLDAQRNIKIIDFGFANVMLPDGLLKTFCGSPAYAAPEMVAGKEYYGPEVDIWSMGVILYALLCGYLPFDHRNIGKLYQLILAGEYECPDFLSEEAQDLISIMLVPSVEERCSITDIINHPWMNLGYDTLCFDEESYTSNRMKIDPKIVEKLESMGFDTTGIEEQLAARQHNQITATYQLLRQQGDKEIPVTVSEQLEDPFENDDSSDDESEEFYSTDDESEYETDSEDDEEDGVRRQDSKRAVNMGSLNIKINKGGPLSGRRKKPNMGMGTISETIAEETIMEEEEPEEEPSPFVIPPFKGAGGDGVSSKSSKPVPDTRDIYAKLATFKFGVDDAVEEIISEEDEQKRLAAAASRRRSKSVSVQAAQEITFRAQEEEESSSSSSSSSAEQTEEDTVVRGRNRTHSVDSHAAAKIAAMFVAKMNINLREVKGAFNVETTSSKQPQAICQEIDRVLREAGVESSGEGFMFTCFDKKSKVRFELEVVKIRNLPLNGIRLKRLAGDTWAYKKLCQYLTSQMKL